MLETLLNILSLRANIFSGERTNVCGAEVLHMESDEYRKQIIQMVGQITDDAVLRRIYLILVVIVGTDF